MNIYILTEITKRELDANLFLACIAAKDGFNVIISNHGTIKFLNDKKLLKEGIFHTKSLVHGEKKKELHESFLTPNDTYFSSSFSNGQWGLYQINAPQAWDISTGDANVVVAVTDNAPKGVLSKNF